MADHPMLPIPSTADTALERALRARLGRGADSLTALDSLERLALQIGLIQHSDRPTFSDPSLVIFAADHGLVVDSIAPHETRTTAETAQRLATGQLPLAALCRRQGLELMIVDSGIADPLEQHKRLHLRKIAHGTRNSRAGWAMSIEQVRAAIRAGIEVAEALDGNAVACAGIGVGSAQSAALLLSALAEQPAAEFVDADPALPPGLLEHTVLVLDRARQRHVALSDPIERLAAMGGFEVAMMVGLMLGASARRFVILPDGLPACAALMVASAIAPAVVDYCIHTRRNRFCSWAADGAPSLFDANVAFEISPDAIDGTGATLTWPLIPAAAALLSAAH